jgi:diguanylate cyclase (GGDEF)-like protein
VSGFLDQRTSFRRLRVGVIAALLLVVATLVILRHSGAALPVVAPFIPIYATTVILVEGLTAFFLAIQFRAMRQAFFGGLAGAYGFVMVTAICQLLIFPGVFSTTGLLGAGPQSAVWLWVFWHAGFPVTVMLALLTRLGWGSRFEAAMPRIGTVLIVLGPAAALAAAYLSIHAGRLLPELIAQNTYSQLRESFAAKLVVVALLSAILLSVLVTRLRDLLSLWVTIALLASLGDTVLVLAGGARYSLGWYGGRLLSVVSSSVVLCALIAEFSRAYQNLVAANFSLSERVMRDGLTNAFNRRFFDEQYRREWRRAVRESAPISLLMIDVDHFKAYNDICGHQMGDECLIAIVGALQTALRRPGDFVARYGGEEFVAVLPRTGAQGAMAQAEAARAAVAALRLSHGAGGFGTVTVSIGIASSDPATERTTPEDLLQRADIALYDAKNTGRDKIIAFALLPALA